MVMVPTWHACCSQVPWHAGCSKWLVQKECEGCKLRYVLPDLISSFVRWRREQHIPLRDRRTGGFHSLKIWGCQAMSHSWGWILLPLRECIFLAAFWCQLVVSWLECSLLSREKTCVLSQWKTHRKFRQDVLCE